jgi:methylglutaconyl-CoA hydratase
MIEINRQENTAVITLNRPEKRNALNPELVSDIKAGLAEAAADNNIKVVVITGSGNSFCAGADLDYLNKLTSYSSIDNIKDSENLAGLFLSLYKFPKPVIAAVNGPAIAGGCGLASVCDFIVADELNAKFGYTEVKIGFLPAIVSLFLIRRTGEGFAKQLLLSGEVINAARAYEIGFVNYLAGSVMEKSLDLAGKLGRNSALSMSLAKKMIHTVSGMSIDEAVYYCTQLNVISRSSEDFKINLTNFTRKSGE